MSAVIQSTRRTIPLTAIVTSQTEAQAQRRKAFSKDDLAELATSIKQHGLVNPILVRPVVAREVPGLNGITVLGKTYFSPDEADAAARDRFELVAGERRYLAAQIAGLDEIEATVRELTDEQVLEVQLIENLQRTDLHPLHEAEGYEQLMTVHGHTADELADKVGKSRRYVYARIQLLKLCKEARQAFYEGELNASTALWLARIPVESLQKEALKEIVHDVQPMSTREAAAFIQRRYMLRLSDAPFPTNVDNLIRSTPACGRCPKNTLSQPELFSDVQSNSAGVCTDPVCFQKKKAQAIEDKILKAKQLGQVVITGGEAKKIFPYGGAAHGGYHKLDDHIWIGNESVKVRSLVKKDTPITLVRVKDQFSGDQLIEVVHGRHISKAKTEQKQASTPSKKAKANDEAQRARDRKVRARVFRAVFLKSPTKLERKLIEERVLDEIDQGMVDLMDLCEALEWDDFNMDTPEKEIKKLSDADLYRLMSVLPLVDELSPYGGGQLIMKRAKELKIDVATIRKQVTAEEKAAAKAAAASAKASKKSAKKKAKAK